MTRAAKWWATMKIAWQEQLAYRVNFFLLVIGPALVFFFVKVSLWTSIYDLGEGARVGGYLRGEMLAYQCYVLAVSLLSQGYRSVPLSEDIRHGRVTSHLLHPFSFLEFHSAHWLAFQVLQLGVVGVLLAATLASGLIPAPAPGDLLVGLGFTCLVSLLWFAFSFQIGLMAFWLEETWVLRVILMQLAGFLSGSILPLELYPAALREALVWTPFPYLTWVPARLLAGAYEPLGQAVLVTVTWILVGWVACVVTWRRGLRLYSAAGM